MTDFQTELNRCKQLMAEGKLPDALNAAKNLLQEQPENMPLHHLLASLYVQQGMLQEAASHYLLLCQFDPGFEEHHCNQVAKNYYEAGMPDMAAVLSEAAGIKLGSNLLLKKAAYCYAQAGYTEKAEKLKSEL